MAIMTPDELLTYWTDENAQVNGETARIMDMLMEAAPNRGRPEYLSGCAFVIPLAPDADLEFMGKVSQRFRDAGWTATIKRDRSIALVLTSPVVDQMPR